MRSNDARATPETQASCRSPNIPYFHASQEVEMTSLLFLGKMSMLQQLLEPVSDTLPSALGK